MRPRATCCSPARILSKQFVNTSEKFIHQIRRNNCSRLIFLIQTIIILRRSHFYFRKANKRFMTCPTHNNVYTMIKCKTIRLDEIGELSELCMYHSFHDSPFGKCLIAFIEDSSKQKVICFLSFVEKNEIEVLDQFKKKYSGAQFCEDKKQTKELINKIFHQDDAKNIIEVQALLKGTDFQMTVWEKLITIPVGTLTTYEKVAQEINNPKATRAVASALKANQIGYVIPCHRVVSKNGCNKFSWCGQIKVGMQEYEKKLIAGEK